MGQFMSAVVQRVGRNTAELIGDIERDLTVLIDDLNAYSFRMSQDQKGITALDMLKTLRMYHFVILGMKSAPGGNIYSFEDLNRVGDFSLDAINLGEDDE
jgi:hypothetical protein